MSQTQGSPAAPGTGDGVIRVLVADRSTPFRDAIRRVLDDYADCTLIGEVSNLPEAVGLAAKGHPDLVLLDFDLVANDNAGHVRRLVETFPSLRVAVLLTEYSEAYRRAVRVRWGYMCMAKDRLEEHLACILADIKPIPVQ